MALTPSGAISLSNINTALGRSATAPISMNDANVRFLADQDTGSVDMNAMRNKYNFSGTITIGYYYDGITEVIGYDGGTTGSVSPTTIWGAIQELNGSTMSYGTSMFLSTVDPAPGTFSMRFRSNNVTVNMTRYFGSNFQWSNGALTPVVWTAANTGQTLSWQFAQQ